MKTDTKVVGIVMCRNEWGLIALSISHALINHVDEVYVLDHSSDDQTHHGLLHLQSLWQGRLHIINLHNDSYYQQATTNFLIHLSQTNGTDWIYVFDADEFLMIENHVSLKDYLSTIEPDQIGVRYQLANHISTSDFDINHLDHYRKLRYRSIPTKHDQPSKLSSKQIYHGEATFFDYPFASKIIFRNISQANLIAGAHEIYCYEDSGYILDDPRISSAHLPMPTKARLENKAKMGEQHIKRGAPPGYGWQNQLIYKIKTDGNLDWFWERHSVPENDEQRAGQCNYVADDTFINSIEPTLQFLESGFNSIDISKIGDTCISKGTAKETMLPMHICVEHMQNLQNIISRLNLELRKSRQRLPSTHPNFLVRSPKKTAWLKFKNLLLRWLS